MWLVWIAMFLGVEGMALFNSKPGDTLSEHIWAWFGTQRRKPGEPERPRSGWTQARRFGLLAFMAWLSAHFLTGGWV
jgi:hypothetical protein